MPAVLIEYLHQHDVARPVSRGESVACRPSLRRSSNRYHGIEPAARSHEGSKQLSNGPSQALGAASRAFLTTELSGGGARLQSRPRPPTSTVPAPVVLARPPEPDPAPLR